MHSHHHDEKRPTGNLEFAFWINAIFALIELAGGLATHSFAVLSGALHDFGDSIALGLAWYFQRISGRKRDETYSFGYKRFSVLSALINSLIMFGGSCVILFHAVPRIIHPEPVHAAGMSVLAILGIAVNGLAVLRLKKGSTQNEKVISIHFLEDVLGWIAVLVISIVLRFYEIPVIDPLLSLAITVFILYRLFGSLKETFRILLQGVPDVKQANEIRKRIGSLKEVTDMHDLHLWTMDGVYHVATFHLEVAEELSLQETENLKNSVRSELQSLGIAHSTIEIELQGRECAMNDC
jgi:cobalt-zinc-cadmium efflux system protein